MKKILIALDYNPTAQLVAETGYKLAKAMRAKVTLMHVIVDSSYYSSFNYSPIMGYTGVNPADLVQLVDNTKIIKAAQKFLDTSKKHLGDDAIDTLVKEGDFSETILQTAKELDADIIVLGSHSRRGLEKILVGSVAEKVLAHTTIPLFIIPVKENSKK